LQRPAIFFDRDGVLNKDLGYVYKKENFIWIPGAMETIEFYKNKGYTIFIVTNQSGIARGYYTEKDVYDLHHWINNELFRQYHVLIDSFYYCPHHPTDGLDKYKIICDCRKPKPGLINKAISEFNIDRKRSYFIGDKDTDMEAAFAADIKGFKFHNKGNLLCFMKKQPIL